MIQKCLSNKDLSETSKLLSLGPREIKSSLARPFHKTQNKRLPFNKPQQFIPLSLLSSTPRKPPKMCQKRKETTRFVLIFHIFPFTNCFLVNLNSFFPYHHPLPPTGHPDACAIDADRQAHRVEGLWCPKGECRVMG